jgi:hypothetical protein
MFRRALFILSLSVVSACGDSDPPAPAQEGKLWHCDYINSFSKQAECREYRGAGWSEANARTECDDQSGALAAGACAAPATLGTCVVPESAGAEIHILFTGEDTSTCSTLNQVCETFASGDFMPTAACEGKTDDPVPPLGEPDTQLVCVDPQPGEPPGQSEGGKVCTWESLNGCTELGRNYADYVSCEPAYEARGYYPAPPAPESAPDPRMQDPAYAAEVAWVKAQTEACSCVCCHQGSRTPAGAAIWDTELDGNFLNSFTPWGLAFMAGFVDSSILGYRPAEENNGFSRETTGMPTQDPERVLKFFTEELAHRGYTPEDFAE